MSADELLDAFDLAWKKFLRDEERDPPVIQRFLLLPADPEFDAHQTRLKEIEREYRQQWKEASETAADAGNDRFPLVPGYQIEAEIGRGGKGVVYRARQTDLDRLVALKTIDASAQADERAIQRLRNEAHVLATLNHTNVVTIHSLVETEFGYWLVMEYVEGTDLARLSRQQMISSRDAARFIRDAAIAIEAAHSQGILHRDLKPSNILLDVNRKICVTDFGLSRQIWPDMMDQSLTVSTEFLGTPGYVSPEQASGRNRELDVRADVYGLGATLYHLLTGRAPFVGDYPLDVLQQVRETDPVAPRMLQPAVPIDLQTICMKCLEKNAAQRYGSAQEVADELDRCLNGQPIAARPVGAVTRWFRWCRRNPVTATLLTIVTCLLLISGGLLIDRGYRQEQTIIEANQQMTLLRTGLQREQAANAEVYDSRMRQAFLEYQANKLDNVRQILDLTRPSDGALPTWEWRWLNGLLSADSWTVNLAQDKAEWIGAVAFSPDGRQLAAGPSAPLFQDRERGVQVFISIRDVETGEELKRLAPTFSIRDLLYSRDGTILYAAECDLGLDRSVMNHFGPGRIRRWSTATWEELPPLFDGWPVEYILLSEDERQVVTFECTPYGPKHLLLTGLQDASGGETACDSWQPPSDSSEFTMVIDGETSRVAIGDLRAKQFGIHPFYEMKTYGNRFILESHMHETSDAGITLTVYSHPGRQLLRTLSLDSVEVIAMDRDETLLAVASTSGQIRMWDTATWAERPAIRGHQARVRSMHFSSDGQLLASGDWVGNVKLWDLRSSHGAMDSLISRPGVSVEAFDITSDGRLVAFPMGHPISFVDLVGSEPEQTVEAPVVRQLIAPCRRHAIADQGQVLFLPAEDNENVIEVRRLPSLDLIRQLPPHTSRVAIVKPVGELTITVAWPPGPREERHGLTAEIYGVGPDNELVFSHTEPGSRIFRVAVDPLRECLSASVVRYNQEGDSQAFVRTWNLKSGQLIDEFLMPDWVLALEFDANGHLWAIDFENGDLHVRDIHRQTDLTVLPGFSREQQDLCFTADGRRLVGSTRSRVSVWNVETK
ncbi:MAG: protein kinase, partial [Planctomycetaceae bacterium]|nr:protein kinase [Planctomycetaceae bacterium]